METDKSVSWLMKMFDLSKARAFEIYLVFIKEVLGTACDAPQAYADNILAHRPDSRPDRDETKDLPSVRREKLLLKEAQEKAAEIKAAGGKTTENGETEENEEEDEFRAPTVFRRNELGQIFLPDYMLKGFFKGACQTLRRIEGTKSKKLTSFKKVIDGTFFVYPEDIPIFSKDGTIMTNTDQDCVRTLRVSGPKGERVLIVSSESIKRGSYLHFNALTLDGRLSDTMLEWFDYGRFVGLGQWRNSGKGQYVYAIKEVDPQAVIDANVPKDIPDFKFPEDFVAR